ncbi:MAG TPA: hypothetical protein VNT26_05020, partial [Candidatus Sulfotelmatobacter sp.]|nr:hypothetical protein [Candidatus Sulfotelmatobacter sp.]
MKTGRSVYSEIKSQESAAEADINTLSEALSQTQFKIAKAGEKRTARIAELAALYMEAPTAAELGGRLTQITVMLNEMQAAKKERREVVETLFKATKARREELAQQLEEARRQERAATNEQAQATAEGDREAAQTAEWKALEEAGHQTEAQLQKAQAAQERALKLLQEKRGAYESNAEFAYLSRRQWPQKQSLWPWIRLGDELLAGRLDFKAQWQRYQSLVMRPKVIGAVIEQGQQEQSQRRSAQQALVEVARQHHEVPKLEAIRQEREKVRLSLERQANALDQELQTLQGELKEILENRSGYESSLKQEIQSLLAKLNPEEMLRAAAQTRSSQDDPLAAEIQQLGQTIDQLKAQAKQLESDLAAAQEKANKINRLRRRFENEDYHDSSSEFRSGFDINSLLMGYVLGQQNESSLWKSLASAQSWRHDESVASPGFSSSSSFGSSSSSSSWSTSSSSGGG